MAEPKSRRRAESSAVSDEHPLVVVLAAFLDARLNVGSPPAHLCVGLSGGRDSVVLLHALRRLLCLDYLQFKLSALHVHHGLSANADDWAAFCSALCARHALPLSVVRVSVPQSCGEGPEAAARRARHAAFADCDADFLALAHHRDDQAETVLLNLLRGAGIAGAAGMLAERAQGRGPTLLRPLLEVSRALIEDYASANSLRWIDDESNDDTHFRRNYLRHEVIPRLAAKFPGAPQSLARAASHFAEGAQLLTELAAIDRAALATASGRIDLAGFNALAPARARNLLRFVWLAAGFRAPDTRWIDEALRQLASADGFSETCVATVDGELHVYRGELPVVGHARETVPVVLPWSGEPQLAWAGGHVALIAATGSGIDRRLLLGGEVTLRPRLGGERLRLDAKRPSRSLGKHFQDAAIPPWERSRLPLLWVGDQLAWVGGLGVDAAFACAPGEAGVLPEWQPGAT
jgi:tRNA(Ile)-lysidine synthase